MERNAVTVAGDLGGIRRDSDKGRYVNDETRKIPFARLLSHIEYKAHDAGIDVRSVEEYDASKTCNRCGCEGFRETQGRFACPECGLDGNADENGAFENRRFSDACESSVRNALNIGNRASGEFSKPLAEAEPYWHGPKRRSSSRATTTPRTAPSSWVQPPRGPPQR
ncbi:zinc ribbon domain-containing protein [Natronorubrum sp. FCH18a]|uniref:zinc ribbon domain-containing protein n=1 Tax=Natronorubrum sp. FCH18a TaxID=3447018 RepID=UPI003F50DC26